RARCWHGRSPTAYRAASPSIVSESAGPAIAVRRFGLDHGWACSRHSPFAFKPPNHRLHDSFLLTIIPSRTNAIVDRRRIGLYASPHQGETQRVGRFVGDGDVRAAIAEGGRIDNVIVVTERDRTGRAEFVPYFTTSWRRGYVAIGLWAGDGARSWRDLTRLLGFFREDFQYHGPICIHEADDPRLRRFRTVGATQAAA